MTSTTERVPFDIATGRKIIERIDRYRAENGIDQDVLDYDKELPSDLASQAEKAYNTCGLRRKGESAFFLAMSKWEQDDYITREKNHRRAC